MKMVGFIERANMYGEHLRENSRMSGHRGHRRAPELSMIAERDQKPCHQIGTPRDLAMPPLVHGQITALNCLGQCRGLTECEAKPLARDCVHRSRSISD
jgi:hypothetical protein